MRALPVFSSVAFAFALVTSVAASASAAESEAPKKATLGADLAVALPVGNFSDAAGIGFGGLVRFDYRVIDTVSVGGRAGYIFHLGKDLPGGGSVGLSEAPIFGAVRYHFLGAAADGPYAALELGPVLLFGRGTSNGVSVSSSDTKFGGTLTGGYRLGAVDLRAGLLMLDLGHLGDSLSIALGAGYTFAAF